MLEYIKNNRDTLEKEGLLMPRILAHVNLKEAYDHLRFSYFQNKAWIVAELHVQDLYASSL